MLSVICNLKSMANVLQAPGFGIHYPTFAQNLSVQRAPSVHPSQPWGIPAPSVGNKIIEPMTNGNARSYVRAIPFSAGWESNYCTGMPLFVNSTKSTPGAPSILAASPAVINYYLEEGARNLSMAISTSHKKRKTALVEDYCARDHLYCDNSVDKFLNTWRYYGYIYSIMGKGSESGLQGSQSHGEEYVFNCTVYKTADIINYWGNVSDGDRIGWTVGLKRNIYPYFYNPSGAIVGDGRHSPEYFLQLIPVSFGSQGYSVAHNRNFKNPDDPARDDIDFLQRNMSIEQEDLIMNMQTGVFTSTALDLSKERIKTTKLSSDLYSYGGFIPVGVVNKGSRTRIRANQYDLNLALRSDVKAQTLGTIQVFLGC